MQKYYKTHYLYMNYFSIKNIYTDLDHKIKLNIWYTTAVHGVTCMEYT